LLIDFLNSLLPDHHQIADLHYTDSEQLGRTAIDRKAIFDLACSSTGGERFIVEMQKAKQNYFKDCSLFYATFPIQQQSIKGNWDYPLSAVYTIGILDFEFDEDKKKGVTDAIHRVHLKNQRNELFSDKFNFIYITLPNFTKTEDQLLTHQDKWIYAFKQLARLDDIPRASSSALPFLGSDNAKHGSCRRDQMHCFCPRQFSAEIMKDMNDRKILKSRFFHKDINSHEAVEFDESEESDGTLALLAFAGPWLDVIEKERVFVVDELDTSLHPLVVHYLVNRLHHASSNAQLIFSTHDTTLLSRKLLRRDQVWFMEKDAKCATRLYPLPDFSPRDNEAVERGYLNGRYGGIPFSKDLDFLLGLMIDSTGARLAREKCCKGTSWNVRRTNACLSCARAPRQSRIIFRRCGKTWGFVLK